MKFLRTSLLLPWLLVFVVFWMIPILASFVMSFTDYTFLQEAQPSWVGIDHYADIMMDRSFWNALGNTALFTIGTMPTTIIFALISAAILNEVRSFQALFRTAFFLPSVLSITVLCMIFDHFYTRDGYIGRVAIALGHNTTGLLLQPSTALLSIMAMDIFAGVGYYTVLFLAAMKGVGRDIEDSVRLTGASFFQKLRHITLPLIRPMVLFAIVINTIKNMQLFTEVYMLTKGGPLQSTTTIVFQLYETGFRKFDAAQAAALAYILLAMTGIIAWLQIKWLTSGSSTSQ